MKTIREVIFISLVFMLAACGQGGSDSPSVTEKLVTGIDMSGNYIPSNVTCYDINDNPLASYPFTTGNSPSISINGNTFLETLKSGSCTVVIAGEIYFSSSSKMSRKNRRVLSATNDSCTIDPELSSGLADSNSPSITYSTNQVIADEIDIEYFIYVQNSFQMPSHYTEGGTGYCSISYFKQ